MNRKTLSVSSSTLRRRTRVDVDKRLKEISDDCTKFTDFEVTGKQDRRDVIGQFLEERLHCTDNDTCSDIAAGVVFSEEEGGMEVDADISENFVVGDCDEQIQTSDSECDDEFSEIFTH